MLGDGVCRVYHGRPLDKMDKSIPIEERVKSAVTSGSPLELEEALREISTTRTRKGKQPLYAQVNAAITRAAFERGDPGILNLITDRKSVV